MYNHPLQIPRSSLITGLEWTSPRTSCPMPGMHGDTHPMAWADDDEIYMSAGDPNWAVIDGVRRSVLWNESVPKPEIYPHVGGLDVEKLTGYGAEFGVEQVNTMPGFMGPGGFGAKPSGMICVKGSLYLAAQNLLGKKPAPRGENSQHGSDATIIRSDDYGKSWYPDIEPILTDFENALYDRVTWTWANPPEERTSWKGWTPMFPGPLFGGPTFIQYGRNNEQAIDEYIYAISGDQWDNGSELRVGRVHQDHIIERDAWTWANVSNDGTVSWVTSPELAEPVLSIHKHIGLPEMFYLPSLQRYVLLTWGLHKDFHTEKGSELTVLDSPNPWGPFTLVHYEEIWDQVDICPYTPRVPLKWFDEANLSGWMLYSGNWFAPEPWYKPHVRPFQLKL